MYGETLHLAIQTLDSLERESLNEEARQLYDELQSEAEYCHLAQAGEDRLLELLAALHRQLNGEANG